MHLHLSVQLFWVTRRRVLKVQSHALSIKRKMACLTQAASAMPVARCQVRSCSGAGSFSMRATSRVVLHLW